MWALLTPSLFAAATPIYKTIWLQTHASIVPFSLLRFACTGAILLVPTTCMGATLPLLARHVTTSLETVGSRVGTLYAANTLGAVVGAVLTGFVLLPVLGLSATTLTAALVNAGLFLAVCVIALLTRKFAGASPVQGPLPEMALVAADPASKSESADAKERMPLGTIVILVAFAISGGVAMTYEVCWTRTLLMVVGSSTYAFSVMLSAFLIGIFAGSLLCSRFIDSLPRPQFVFAILQLVLGILTLVSMGQFNQVPYLNLSINGAAPLDDNGQMLVRFILAGNVLIPTTLCLGAIFPVVVKACAGNLATIGRSVGTLYSANTLGAIIGAFIAGFILLPAIGAEKTLYLGAFINTVLGFVLLWVARPVGMVPAAFATLCGVVLTIGAALTVGGWDHLLLLSAQASKRRLQTSAFTYKSFDAWQKSVHALYVAKFWADGPCSNVGVLYAPSQHTTILATNGHVDATDGADMPVQSLVSGFPLLLKPDAQNMCVIGWGAGQTVGTATLFPVKSIEAIELEPNVITASKFFHHVNGKPEEDKRVHIQYNDGRNFLLATNEKFDIIVSEPSNPWQAGVCNLFTQEYFQVCKERLKKDGLLSVWLQTGEVPPGDVCAVLTAVRKTFPHMVAFLPREGNIIVVASEQPIKVPYEKVRNWLADEHRDADYQRVGVRNVDSFIAHMAVASDGVDSLTGGTLPNTDDKNKLEFDVGKSYETRTYLSENVQLLSAMAGNPWDQVDWGSLSTDQKADSMLNIAKYCIDMQRPSLARGWAEHSLALRPLAVRPSATAYRLMGIGASAESNLVQAEELFSKGLALGPDDVDLLLLRGSARLRLKQNEGARVDLEKLVTNNPNSKIGRYLLALSYLPALAGGPYSSQDISAGKDADARTVVTLLGSLPDDADFVERMPTVVVLAGRAQLKLGHLDEAQKYATVSQSANEADLRGKLLLEEIAKARSAAKQ